MTSAYQAKPVRKRGVGGIRQSTHKRSATFSCENVAPGHRAARRDCGCGSWLLLSRPRGRCIVWLSVIGEGLRRGHPSPAPSPGAYFFPYFSAYFFCQYCEKALVLMPSLLAISTTWSQ